MKHSPLSCACIWTSPSHGWPRRTGPAASGAAPVQTPGRARGAHWLAALLLAGASAAGATEAAADCIAPLAYHALDVREFGADADGTAALGTYERISPDGRFVLRSYSGAQLGQVSLVELPAEPGGPVRAHPTPLSNEAFPVQGSWRYLVDVNGEHYRFAEVLRDGRRARPLFRGGMTGFYAAASELPPTAAADASTGGGALVRIRSLSWPQDADPDRQGVGPLQVATIEVRDDGRQARLVRTLGPRFICDGRVAIDGNAYALPMLSVDGSEFSAIPQAPRVGAPSMRVYRLAPRPGAGAPSCDLDADLGRTVSKAVFGFARPDAAAWLVYSDLGSVYLHDRALGQGFRLDRARDRVQASAFPGLTRDGRVIYGASWQDCDDRARCPRQAGYVVVDPYQSQAWRAHWQARGQAPPKACITRAEVARERRRFAEQHGLDGVGQSRP